MRHLHPTEAVKKLPYELSSANIFRLSVVYPVSKGCNSQLHLVDLKHFSSMHPIGAFQHEPAVCKDAMTHLHGRYRRITITASNARRDRVDKVEHFYAVITITKQS